MNSGQGLLPFLVSLGNTWGLVQIVFFLSNGLVEVPQLLWRKGDFRQDLKYLFAIANVDSEITCSIAKIEIERRAAISDIQTVSSECRRIAPQLPCEYYNYLEQILAEVPLLSAHSVDKGLRREHGRLRAERIRGEVQDHLEIHIQHAR